MYDLLRVAVSSGTATLFFLSNFAIIEAIMDLYEELKSRGLVYQVSNEEGVKKLLNA